MKRRQFLTTAALTAIGATVAPQILKGQDPYEEYAKMEQELLNWYIAPRKVNVHHEGSNYWHLLKGKSVFGHVNAIEKAEQYHYAMREKLGPEEDGRLAVTWDEGGFLHIVHDVHLRDYANVYECKIPISINKHEYYNKIWMNVEDYEFYNHWMMGEFPYDCGPRQLMGVELVPGLVDPFNLNTSILKGHHNTNVLPIISDRIGVVDSYEIHVMWRKR